MHVRIGQGTWTRWEWWDRIVVSDGLLSVSKGDTAMRLAELSTSEGVDMLFEEITLAFRQGIPLFDMQARIQRIEAGSPSLGAGADPVAAQSP